MSKNKAIVCTILMIIVVFVVLTVSHFISNEELGINLYGIITSCITYLWVYEFLKKFYEWLIK